ncbi:hypothetical protein A2961_00240 [Candidatus Woesebacteria bacterium RIFCSPLOWO2_01_FULL_39_21]|uniref:Glycosyltransferase subfamily 4-like N-terminal domain-containing protein n=1 Tax=Candidatus Woesebacteria bacterium RIFCSPLOWO2_01_FULL_39_21 TaxID=1802519 RepID=A0A1F8BJR0_9BACT|nr:MAG: hypothetical protein A2691_02835 [Candidatus Woesebacteria bacterium RIFCSPHIGHO2_01_FULL_39_23]OGM64306.1 MAG: hypothetical protein A2961_00240 [Candidatus Woesebacteria bacterium RIFCSPLOWO2_01_FULL_39_21]
MKIIIIQPFLSWGGAEAVSVQFANALTKTGHKSKIVCLYKTPSLPHAADKVEITTPPKFIYELLAKSYLLMTILGLPILLVLTLVNSVGVDLINPHNFPSLWVAVVVGKLRRIPVIWTVHNFPQSPLPPLFDKFFARQCKTVIAVSQKVAGQVYRNYKIKAKVIYPGIDHAFWSKLPIVVHRPPAGRQARLIAGKFVVLTAGRLKSDKSFDIAISSFAQASLKIKNAVLNVVGSGPDLVRLRTISSMQSANVKFIGYQTPEQLRNWYTTADLFLLPSYKTEGCNLTPLEALCSGVPSVVAKGSGVDEIFEKYKLGLVAEPTIEDFSGKIIDYHDNYKENSDRRNLKNWVQKNLSWDNYVNKFIELI